MKTIQYSTPHYLSDYLYLYNIKIKKFMKQKPPCALCLKEFRCVRSLKKGVMFTYGTAAIEIRYCEDLNRFIKNHRKFKRIKYG